nr:hypothetical protein [Tanacetum cinerariifolium]
MTMKSSLYTPLRWIRGDIGITTFRNAFRAHYLPHSRQSPSHPSPSTLVVGEMHKEAQQAAGGPTSLGAHPQLNYGCDALAYSTAEANPRKFAPNDSIPSQQGMDEGTKNYSIDHIFEGTNPSVLVDKTKYARDGLKTAHTDLVQVKLQTLDTLPSLLKKVANTLTRFASIMKNASHTATSKGVPSASPATTSHAEGEKNTNHATKDAKTTNLHNELVDLLGIDIMTQYYNKKLLYDKYCDKMLKRKKISKIINCNVLTQKGPYHT